MSNTDRVDKEMFNEGGHYLGKPADISDRLIHRRIALTCAVENFTGKDYDLVEIGCGNGATIILLADKMKSCLGLDINNDHEEEFNQLRTQYKADNCVYKVCDVEKEEPLRQFDRMISFEVIEHLQDDRNVKAYYDMLKPGGLAVFSVPNKWWIFETHGASLPLLPWNRVPFFSWLPRPIHERYANARIYTRKRILNLLETTGFEIMESQYITAPLDVLKEGSVKRFFTKNVFKNDTTGVPFLSTSIFIAVRKPAEK
jgi:2-polyprenyl-3-methyl-5-hydroxy-6-metoxy-1,4-benzoquinol methylase